MAECNDVICTCPKVTCEQHGKCCECIKHHLKPDTPPLVFCMRARVAEAKTEARA